LIDDIMSDSLPSWKDGPAKQAIFTFVKETTTAGSPSFVDPQDRIAAFDQDGTTWVEQPSYAQVMFALQQLAVMADKDPRIRDDELFKTVLSGDAATVAKLQVPELLKIVTATHSGMSVEEFQKSVESWITTAQHPRYQRLYTDLVYLPMIELLEYLRANDASVQVLLHPAQADWARGHRG
jgi:hypothetical protein